MTALSRIFLSYTSSERELTKRVVTFLQAAGHTVWWDKDIVGGDAYRKVIEDELDAADVVIVLWTPTAVRSLWVIAEAEHGLRLGKLLPLRTSAIKDWQIPKPFGTLQTQLVSDETAVLQSIQRIVSRDRNRQSVVSPSKPRSQVHKTAEASAKTQITTYLTCLGFLLFGSSLIAAHWNWTDKARIDKIIYLLGSCSIATLAIVTACFVLCRHMRTPVYATLLTSHLSNVGIHSWTIISLVTAYGMMVDKYKITLFASLGALAIYALLLLFQLRGAAWVFPASRMAALVQVGALTAHVATQTSWALENSSWFTTHSYAFLHVLYVATGVAGAATAAIFLIMSYVFATKSSATS